MTRPPSARLTRGFFARPTLEVARDLVGRRLVRRTDDGERLVARIVEVEAYCGPEDTACHAAKGRTARTEVMFGRPGFAYVYFTYGMHWLLNVVTEPVDRACAVLIRAVEPVSGLAAMRRRRAGRRDTELTSGPARLTQALAITGAQNRVDMVRGSALYLAHGDPLPDEHVVRAPRVGVDYAAPVDRDAPWRLYDGRSGYVSSARKPLRKR